MEKVIKSLKLERAILRVREAETTNTVVKTVINDRVTNLTATIMEKIRKGEQDS